MYDNILYGNGLTIAIQNVLKSELHRNKDLSLLYFNDFIDEFLSSGIDESLNIDFMKLFNSDITQYQDIHIKSRSFLNDNIHEIRILGAERWIGQIYFKNIDSPNFSEIKLYLYVLYNYWFHVVQKRYLSLKSIERILNNVSYKLKGNIKGTFYTTNFDLLISKQTKSKHIHGKFIHPLKKISNIIHFFYEDGKKFEYSYLFGTSGLEKLNRLNKISEHFPNSPYYYDFFSNKFQQNLGHLLIYGLSFSKNEMLSPEFLTSYPQHETLTILNSVDGHIIHKLEILYEKELLNKITISFYSQDDLLHLTKLFESTKLSSIIEFKHCKEIFPFL